MRKSRHKPQNSFVAQFIGENNKLNGTVKAVENGVCTVEIPGAGNVSAVAINIDGVNKPTMLSLRPERVEINPPNGQLPNNLEGRIEELIYLGDHIRTRMSVAGHDDFVVKIPNKAGQQTLAEGTTARIGWKTEDCRALDSLNVSEVHKS